MRHAVTKYESWLNRVNTVAIEEFGCPFFAICSNPQIPRQAFKQGSEPRAFIEQFKKDCSPHVAPEMFF